MRSHVQLFGALLQMPTSGPWHHSSPPCPSRPLPRRAVAPPPAALSQTPTSRPFCHWRQPCPCQRQLRRAVMPPPAAFFKTPTSGTLCHWCPSCPCRPRVSQSSRATPGSPHAGAQFKPVTASAGAVVLGGTRNQLHAASPLSGHGRGRGRPRGCSRRRRSPTCARGGCRACARSGDGRSRRRTCSCPGRQSTSRGP